MSLPLPSMKVLIIEAVLFNPLSTVDHFFLILGPKNPFAGLDFHKTIAAEPASIGVRNYINSPITPSPL